MSANGDRQSRKGLSKGKPTAFDDYGRGLAVFGIVLAGAVSAKTVAFTMPLLGVLLINYTIRFGSDALERRSLILAVAPLSAFLLYALASVGWGQWPDRLLMSVLTASAITMLSFSACVISLTERRLRFVKAMAYGALAGTVASAAYLVVEVLSEQAIKIWVYNTLEITAVDIRPASFVRWENGRVVRIFGHDLVRNFLPLTLWFFTSLAVAWNLKGTAGRVTLIVLLGLVVIATFGGLNDTAKLALIAGTVVILVARWSSRASIRLVQAAWIAACLFVVPVSIAAHDAGMHTWSIVPDSGKQRILIWNSAARATLERPLIGIGANMTHARSQDIEAKSETPALLLFHAHNAFLQTWYELGAIGALLFMSMGLGLIGAIARAHARFVPFGLATFTAGMVHAAASYGMWQLWYVASFCMAAALVAIVGRYYELADSADLGGSGQNAGPA
ncbi:MAG: O-antigen ligase family protein [Hyphomicrobiaceae bacterium]